MEKATAYLQAAQIRPVGEGALMVSFGNTIDPEILRCARALVTELEQHPFPGLLEFEASYTGVTVFYDPLVLARESSLPEDHWLSKGYREAAARVKKLLEGIRFTKEKKGDRIRIPVCYGGEYGPDLEEVAEYHHMTPEEVVKIHTGGDYLVYMIGFAPGFPYVGGLPPEIATPEEDSPAGHPCRVRGHCRFPDRCLSPGNPWRLAADRQDSPGPVPSLGSGTSQPAPGR